MRRALPLLLVLIAACPACAAVYSARVVGISDGDTIPVLRDCTQVRVHLHGIDAPETGQDFGGFGLNRSGEGLEAPAPR